PRREPAPVRPPIPPTQEPERRTGSPARACPPAYGCYRSGKNRQIRPFRSAVPREGQVFHGGGVTQGLGATGETPVLSLALALQQKLNPCFPGSQFLRELPRTELCELLEQHYFLNTSKASLQSLPTDPHSAGGSLLLDTSRP